MIPNQYLTTFRDTDYRIIQLLLPDLEETITCPTKNNRWPKNQEYTGVFSKYQAHTTFTNLRTVIAVSKTCQSLNQLCNATYQITFNMPLKTRVIESASVYYATAVYESLFLRNENDQFITPITNDKALIALDQASSNAKLYQAKYNLILTKIKLQEALNLCQALKEANSTYLSIAIKNDSDYLIYMINFCLDSFGTQTQFPLIGLLKSLPDTVQNYALFQTTLQKIQSKRSLNINKINCQLIILPILNLIIEYIYINNQHN